MKVQAIVEDVYFTSKRVTEIINDSLHENCNLHIFINSLNTIRSIIKNINTKNFRTICSKNAEKEDMRLGGKLQVKSINSDVCKVNFYTATAFEGVDIYDPIGKTVVVSDTNISQSLVDISTLFIQICGRLRDSVYKDQVMFIVNTNSHRYLKYRSDEEFMDNSEKTAAKAVEYGKEFLLHGQTSVDINLGSYEDNPIYYQSLYIGRKINTLDFDPNLQKLDKQNYKVVTKFFASSLSVINNLNSTTKVNARHDVDPIYLEIYKALPDKLTLTYMEVVQLLIPILNKYNIYTNKDVSVALDYCSTKRIIRSNNQRVALYNFVKLRSLLGL